MDSIWDLNPELPVNMGIFQIPLLKLNEHPHFVYIIQQFRCSLEAGIQIGESSGNYISFPELPFGITNDRPSILGGVPVFILPDSRVPLIVQ